jgi:hypothetical protein
MMAQIDEEVFAMECFDPCEIVVAQKTPEASKVFGEDKLSALSPSERKNLLMSVACHKEMLEELAKM